MSLDTVWRVYYRMMKPQIGESYKGLGNMCARIPGMTELKASDKLYESTNLYELIKS